MDSGNLLNLMSESLGLAWHRDYPLVAAGNVHDDCFAP